MAKYYATIAGLPNLGVEDRKLPFSSAYFVEELSQELTLRDRHLLNILRWERENRYLIRFLEHEEEAKTSNEQPQLFSYDQIATALHALRQREPLPKSISLPAYVINFLKATQVEPTEEEVEKQKEKEELLDEEERRYHYPTRLEDRLAEYYYDYAISCGNQFIEAWSKFNRTLRNILAAEVGKELGWDIRTYIVGNSPIEKKLRASSGNSLGIDEEDITELRQIQAILAEKDITRRERMIDQLRWNWLEDVTFDRIFDVEALLAYYLRLCIVERWTSLNEKKGEATFRRIVASLKKESNESLEEFKKNQKK